MPKIFYCDRLKILLFILNSKPAQGEAKEKKLEQKQNTSSSEIEQLSYGWKKAALRFALVNKPEKICTRKGKPEKILKLFRDFEKNPKYKIISLEKAPTFRDILRETCQFGPRKKDGDN